MEHRETPRYYELPFLTFSLSDLVDKVLTSAFPEISPTPAVYFARMNKIAFCEAKAPGGPLVVINAVLNHHTTPIEVIETILIHEFLHIVVPGGDEGEGYKSHTTSFFEKEKAISPNLSLTWSWLHLTFLNDLVIDKKAESTRLRNSRRFYKDRCFMSFSQLRELLSSVKVQESGNCF